jgi:acetyl-CoA C-acetyltransferase
MALSEDGDLVALMTGGDPIGARIAVTSTKDGTNRATLG